MKTRLLLLILLLLPAAIGLAQDENPLQDFLHKTTSAPASVRRDVPVMHSNPQPSAVDPAYVGEANLMPSATIDLDAGTVTFPLRRGEMESGETVWFIFTDASDEAVAAEYGIVFSNRLKYADVGIAVRPAALNLDGSVTFARGTVDFSPQHSVTPGEAPNLFPPTAFQPGAVGDALYSPLANINGVIFNAPMVAFDVEAEAIEFCDGNVDFSLVHDRVKAICPSEGTVTFDMALAFSYARPVFYITTDTTTEMSAAMERAIYAPAMQDIVLGFNDNRVFHPTETVYSIANGGMGVDNPQRQGFNSALNNEGNPLPVFGGIPTLSTTYSPLWALSVGEWTAEALELGYRARVIDEFQILGLVEQGWLTGPDNEVFGYSDIIINCPVVYRLY
jgi:hypothetical protein